jgi:hypothetical protein
VYGPTTRNENCSTNAALLIGLQRAASGIDELLGKATLEGSWELV